VFDVTSEEWLHVKRPIKTALALLAAGALTAGCGAAASSTSAGGGASVDVGVASTLSGPFASYGQAGLNGIKLAVKQLDASGGVLGKQVNVVTADDQTDPATGSTVTRNLIVNDHVAALFGSVSSAVAAAQETLSVQYKVPTFFHIANDASLTQGTANTYAFGMSPNTDMEPAAAALAFARQIGTGPVRIATITPNYEFGIDTVKAFLADLTKDGVSYTVTNQQAPALGATSYTSNLAAMLASNPQYVFVGEYGADLVTLTKQGIGLGLFKKATVGAMYDSDVLATLGDQAPTNAIAWDRAPFWTAQSSQMRNFVSDYKSAYGSYPNEFAVIGYSAVQAWAQGVTQAKSFDADQVTSALAGATVPTIRGSLMIRSCDHQAVVPEDTGTIAAAADSTYGLRLWNNGYTAPAAKIIEPCAS
jgi:branched-chain amino acid transport system substrate-binding protein